MKKESILKIISLLIVLVVLVFLTIQLFPLFRGLSTEEGREVFKTKIEGLGPKGILAIIGLMFAQVFLAILPGEPVEVLAGMCYGPIGGMIILLVGALLSSACIFFLVRKFGRDFIYSFVSQEKIERIEHSKWFSNLDQLYVILFILFFLPGTPKDLLVYLGGLLPVKPSKFLIIATLARFPSIISSAIVGANIIDGNWNVIVSIYIASILISGVVIYLFYRNQKEEEKVG